MKNYVKILLTICAVFCFFTVPSIAGTITGIVTMNYEIITDDDTIYIFEEDKKGAELFEFVGEAVTVNGAIRDDEGIKIIKVENFSVIAETEETSSEDLEKTSDGLNQ